MMTFLNWTNKILDHVMIKQWNGKFTYNMSTVPEIHTDFINVIIE